MLINNGRNSTSAGSLWNRLSCDYALCWLWSSAWITIVVTPLHTLKLALSYITEAKQFMIWTLRDIKYLSRMYKLNSSVCGLLGYWQCCRKLCTAVCQCRLSRMVLHCWTRYTLNAPWHDNARHSLSYCNLTYRSNLSRESSRLRTVQSLYLVMRNTNQQSADRQHRKTISWALRTCWVWSISGVCEMTHVQ